MLIAVTATAIGFAFDAGSGNKELGLVFAASYVVGCILAVLAVHQSGVFTAVIQPPLILFVAVPAAYFLFHGSTFTGVKDLLINCGYPLIERFPLMFFTSAAVLLIGMARWYYGMPQRRSAPPNSATKGPTNAGRMAAVTSKMAAILTREPAEDEPDATDKSRRRHSIERPGRAAKPAPRTARAARGGRPVKRAQPSRSRHARPPETENIDPVVERPRRPRPARDVDPPPAPPEPRRRPRRPSAREPRKTPPPVDRKAARERRSRLEGYEPFEPHGTGNGTHHPISRVRYRGSDDGDNRVEHRSRPRSRHALEPESWEYDG